MAELRGLLEQAGHEDVRTHLQSGNVVLSSPLPPRKLEVQLEQQLAEGLGMDIRVLVRTRPELARVVAPAALALHGREIYAWYPDGIRRSPAAKLLDDRRLGVVSTARNWNTVTKLLDLLAD